MFKKSVISHMIDNRRKNDSVRRLTAVIWTRYLELIKRRQMKNEEKERKRKMTVE